MYLGMLKADTIKQVEMKVEIQKSSSDDRESFSKSISASHQRNKYLDSLPCKIIGICLNLDKEETQINEPKDKGIDHWVQGLASER